MCRFDCRHYQVKVMGFNAYQRAYVFFNNMFVQQQSVSPALVLLQTKLRKLYHLKWSKIFISSGKKFPYAFAVSWPLKNTFDSRSYNVKYFLFLPVPCERECLQGFCFWKEVVGSRHGVSSFQPPSPQGHISYSCSEVWSKHAGHEVSTAQRTLLSFRVTAHCLLNIAASLRTFCNARCNSSFLITLYCI